MIINEKTKQFYLQKLSFSAFTPLQEKAFSLYNEPFNLVINSKTGSGKTYAYGLPLIHSLLKSDNSSAIIFLPTKELLLQTKSMLSNLLSDDENLLLSTSSHKIEEIVKRSKSRNSWLLLATINDFETLLDNGCNFSSVKTIVFDEADMLCESDFLPKTIRVSKYFDKSKKILVSATITPNLKPFINTYFGTYRNVGDSNLFDGQRHILINAGLKENEDVLRIVLQQVNPYLMIIFVSKIDDFKQVAGILRNLNLSYITFASSDNNNLRKQKLQGIKSNKYQYVIASDVLSRGLNLNCSHVFNYDLPSKLEYFIHRSGRTARMHQTGYVYTILNKQSQQKVDRLRAKGVPFKNYEIKNGELVLKAKESKITPLIKEAIKLVKKPSKVKPNYKKKYIAQVNKKIKEVKVKEMLKSKRKQKFR